MKLFGTEEETKPEPLKVSAPVPVVADFPPKNGCMYRWLNSNWEKISSEGTNAIDSISASSKIKLKIITWNIWFSTFEQTAR